MVTAAAGAAAFAAVAAATGGATGAGDVAQALAKAATDKAATKAFKAEEIRTIKILLLVLKIKSIYCTLKFFPCTSLSKNSPHFGQTTLVI